MRHCADFGKRILSAGCRFRALDASYHFSLPFTPCFHLRSISKPGDDEALTQRGLEDCALTRLFPTRPPRRVRQRATRASRLLPNLRCIRVTHADATKIIRPVVDSFIMPFHAPDSFRIFGRFIVTIPLPFPCTMPFSASASLRRRRPDFQRPAWRFDDICRLAMACRDTTC